MKNRINVDKISEMRKALMGGPKRYEDLCVRTGLSKQSVARWVMAMRSCTLPEIHIAGWAKDSRGRLFVPMYAWGTAPDAERPGCRLTSAERMRALRARRKGEVA